MTKKLLLLAAVLTAAIAPSIAQQKTQADVAPEDISPDSTTTCNKTFTSGSGSNYLKFCVTQNGNITQYESPQGFEAIDEGVVWEGYGICDTSSGIRYEDYAATGTTNWLPPTISGGSLPMTIKRTTSDGIWTLTQVINRNTTDPAVTISNTLKNNTGVARFVGFIRYADIDANNANGGTFDNYFGYDHESAWGYNPPTSLSSIPPPSSTNRFGVMIYANPTSQPHWAFAQNVPGGPDPCVPNTHLSTPSFFGDGSVAVEWAVTIDGGQSAKFANEYRRF